MDPTSHDDAIRRLASRQGNHMTHGQLAAIGLTRSALAHRRQTGMLALVRRNLYRFAGAAPTPMDRLWAAFLHAGPRSAIAYDSAAAHWGQPGYDLLPAHVLLHRDHGHGKSSNEIYRLHTTRVLTPDHIVVVDGLPFTTPARTAADLAPGISYQRLGMEVDKLWTKGLTDGRRFRAVHTDLQRRGRAGTVKRRAVAAVRGPDYRPPESNLESRAKQILDEAFGVGVWRSQIEVGDDDGPLGRMDFVHNKQPAILEVDSDLCHTSITDTAHDEARRAAVIAAGFEVEPVFEKDIWHRPAKVIAAAEAALTRARRRHRPEVT